MELIYHYDIQKGLFIFFIWILSSKRWKQNQCIDKILKGDRYTCICKKGFYWPKIQLRNNSSVPVRNHVDYSINASFMSFTEKLSENMHVYLL